MSGADYLHIGPTEGGHDLTFDNSGILSVDGTPVSPEFAYQTIYLENVRETRNDVSEFVFDPVALTGQISRSLNLGPFTVGTTSGVSSPPLITVNGIDTTNDQWSVTAVWFATNLAGTEAATLTQIMTINIAGPNQNQSLDWNGSTFHSIAGSDLSYVGGTELESAAGGTFFCSVYVQASYN